MTPQTASSMADHSCTGKVLPIAALAIAFGVCLPGTADAGAPNSGAAATDAVVSVYRLPDTPLASTERFIHNDRNVLLGGIGSDLWHDPADPPNRFWMITDRGPNGEVKVDSQKRRTFPVPEFSPLILYAELADHKIAILRKIPIVDSSNRPVGGLSNAESRDEIPYAFDGRTRLPCNPNGLDTEGFVRTSNGHFWLAEEYSPSIVHCDPNGKILKRYIPAGLELSGTGYPVAASLPDVLVRRRQNRGFEGMAISRDEKTLYAIMQSPLSHPDKRTGEVSRNVRLLAFDLATEEPVAEYVYRLEDRPQFTSGAKKTSDLKISGLAMLEGAAMLVLERTDDVARIYKIDLAGATNILDSRWDRQCTSPSLEALNDLHAAEIAPASKSLVQDLSQLPNMPRKIEGIAVIDARTIAVANDSDFDLGTFDAAGKNRGAGVKSLICVIRLNSPLPPPR